MTLSVADVEPVQSSEQSREQRKCRRADEPEERYEKTEEAEDLLLGPESVKQDKRTRVVLSLSHCLHMGLAYTAMSYRGAGAIRRRQSTPYPHEVRSCPA